MWLRASPDEAPDEAPRASPSVRVRRMMDITKCPCHMMFMSTMAVMVQ